MPVPPNTASRWIEALLIGFLLATLWALWSLDGGLAHRFGALGLGTVFALGTWRLRLLSLTGAVAAGGLGAALIGLATPPEIAAALWFFLSANVLTKLPGGLVRERERQGRSAVQVLANGGVGWLLLLVAVWGDHAADAMLLQGAFVASFAAAAADTWGTELGTRFGGTPRRLGWGPPVPPGTSGGISWVGLIGGGLAALSVGGVAVLSGGPVAWLGCSLVGGLAGTLIDSYAGATWQARYQAKGSETLLEEPPEGGASPQLVQGIRWVTNDTVNVICTITGSALGAACFIMLGMVK